MSLVGVSGHRIKFPCIEVPSHPYWEDRDSAGSQLPGYRVHVIKRSAISDNYNNFVRSSASTSRKKPSIRVAKSPPCSCTSPWIVNGSLEASEQLRVTQVSEMFKIDCLRTACWMWLKANLDFKTQAVGQTQTNFVTIGGRVGKDKGLTSVVLF